MVIFMISVQLIKIMITIINKINLLTAYINILYLPSCGDKSF